MEEAIDTGDLDERRFCSACGEGVETNAQFCSACGHAVRPPHTASSPTGSASPPASISETAAAAQQRLLATPERQVSGWILGSSLALGLGSLGPWATATVFGVNVSASGLHGGGWVTLLVAGSAILLLLNPSWLKRPAWLHDHRLGVMFGLAIVAVIVCVLYLVGVEHSGLAGIVHPGWGLYLSTIASAGLTVWAWTARAQRRRAMGV